MTLADDLLSVADSRCGIDSGSTAAHLRRSISTSYYAAFHALSDEVAAPYGEGVRENARRLLDHGAARQVAEQLAKGKMPWLAGDGKCSDHLQEFGEDFEKLQNSRHLADYDLAYTPTRHDATQAVKQARRIVEVLRSARVDCKDQLDATCVAMVANHALRNRMKRST